MRTTPRVSAHLGCNELDRVPVAISRVHQRRRLSIPQLERGRAIGEGAGGERDADAAGEDAREPEDGLRRRERLAERDLRGFAVEHDPRGGEAFAFTLTALRDGGDRTEEWA